MSKYLDREAVLKIVDRRVDLNAKTKPMFQELISLPAADVAPVVHGRWISHKGYCECNLCHNLFGSYFNYCPNCGAKMDGGDNDA